MNRDETSDYNRVDLDSAVVREYDTPTTSTDADDPEVIRANIEQTRAEMSETVNALQERLSPTAIKEQAQEQFQEVKEQVKEQVQEQFQHAKEAVREATIGRVENMVSNASDTFNETRTTMMDTVRQNPIPAALVGIGLGWLFMNRSSTQPVRYSGRGSARGGRTTQVYAQGQRDYRVNYNTGYNPNNQPYYADAMYDDQRGYQVGRGQQSQGGMVSSARETASNVAGTVSNTASNVASSVSDTASNVASSVSDTASNVVDQAQETVSYLTDQAQYQAQRVEDRFQQALTNNPLAVGAITLALGTAVGLALPQTQRENQLMGEARDTLVDRAQDVASETFEKVQRVASEVTDDAKQTVKEQAREQGLTS